MAVADAGPLVAFIDRRDAHHAWARARFAELPAPLLTCEPVLTEALHLVRRIPGAQDALVRQVRAGHLLIAFSLADEIEAVQALLARYADVPMSLADACLVRMAELHDTQSVVTLDTDFRIYRKHRRLPIPLIAPF